MDNTRDIGADGLNPRGARVEIEFLGKAFDEKVLLEFAPDLRKEFACNKPSILKNRSS